MFRLALMIGFLVALAPAVRADVESGPKPGTKVAALKVFAVTGAIENKEVDYVAERKDKPTVYLFVNAEKFSRPMNRFMKVLDGKLAGLSDQLAGVAVWVGGEVDANKEFLPKVQMSVKYEKTALTVSSADKNGPKDWGINSDAHLTVVVVHKGKVIKSFAYESVNETDVTAVEEVIKKELKAK